MWGHVGCGGDSVKNETVAYRICVVCTGNICRSPMGEIVLREKLADAGITDFQVASCGVSSEEAGAPVYPPAARVLRDAGYEVPKRQAHRATDGELAESGLILAMTVGHARSLRSRCEQASVPVSRIHLWREFDGTGLTPAPLGCFGPGGALAESADERRGFRLYAGGAPRRADLHRQWQQRRVASPGL